MALKLNRPETDAAEAEVETVTKAAAETVEQSAPAKETTAPVAETPAASEPEAAEGEIVEEAAGTAAAAEPEQAAAKSPAQASAAPQEPAQQVVVRNEADQQVAVSTGTSQASSYFAKLIEDLKASGQEGLEMGFGVFPIVSLDKGEFKIGDKEIGSDDFDVVPLSSQAKFAYRTTNVAEKDADVVFSDTDTAHLDPNHPVAQRIAEWKMKFPDSGWEAKKYLDVYCYVVSMPAGFEEYEGQVVVLSVAPTSVKRYTNACVTVMGKGYKPHEAVFRVSRGEKVRGEFDFYPWDFRALGSCRKLGVEVKFGGQRDEDF